MIPAGRCCSAAQQFLQFNSYQNHATLEHLFLIWSRFHSKQAGLNGLVACTQSGHSGCGPSSTEQPLLPALSAMHQHEHTGSKGSWKDNVSD